MLEVDKNTFQAEVLEAEGYVFVDFFGDGCVPCQALMPFVHSMADQYGDKLKFTSLNTTKARRLAIGQKILGLPVMAIYKDGEKVEELSADKVFVFTVALKDGFNIITAQAGEVQDTMTLEKVEKEPEIYVLPEVNERAEGVANWFQTVGDMDLKAPMEFPEGRYSIKDTMEELAKNPEAMEIASKAVKLMANMIVSPGEGMWDMMKSMSFERLSEMAGDLAPEGFVESVNAKLIQIKKA